MTAPIEDTIQSIEQLYEALTGHSPPGNDQPYAPIPPEVDASKHVEQQMDRLLALASATPVPMPGSAAVSWSPPITIREADHDIIIDVDLPGVSRDQLTVSLGDGRLEISGRRQSPAVTGAGLEQIQLNERSFGQFHRTITLPARVNSKKTSAKLEDGVLRVRMTRAELEAPKPHAVPIN